MKFERDDTAGRNLFSGYGEGYVEVNGARIRSSVIVTGAEVLPDWGPASIDALTAAHVQAIADRNPGIVLIGTGAAFTFPDRAVLNPLHQARIGVEVMDTRAACRTYNILLGEGRDVLAAVIVTPQ